MKKLTKILAVLLACITVFSTASLAAEGTLPNEETTTLTQEETTLPAEEETTAPAEEETTAPAEEETTAPAEEETTAPEEETTEPVTQPEEETNSPEEETTEPSTQPEEETTAPEEETTEPEKPEIVLPKAPTGLAVQSSNQSQCALHWDYDKTVDGYDVFLKVDGEWVYQRTTNNNAAYVFNLICYSTYEIGVRSFITVNNEKYYSEDMATIIYNSPDEVPYVSMHIKKTYAGGITFTWSNINKGISGYILYKRENNKWVRIATIHDKEAEEFDYNFPDMQVGKSYKFAIKTFVKGTKGTKYSKLYTLTLKISEIGKTELEVADKTASSITLKWDKVEGAKGYRLYEYNSEKKKYETVKTTSKLSYTVTGLDASTKYRFRVRAYYKVNGETKWCTFSDSIPAYTDSKSIKASRVSKYKKYFTDGDWSVKITGLSDSYGNYMDYTFAVRDTKIFIRYDYKSKKLSDFEYLIDLKKEKVYLILDDTKTYSVLDDEAAYEIVYSAAIMGVILDMSDAKGVKAETTLYNDKSAVKEYYTDKETGMKKTFIFYGGKPVRLEVTYADGSSEYIAISRINDTPSSSVFKVPSGYKKVAY
ncbi:MAG: fibronectin type III domain-containing protein [Clostridia bacterium]|nr:fibronectin type III domain-containing protein [Clostridia bacterium]